MSSEAVLTDAAFEAMAMAATEHDPFEPDAVPFTAGGAVGAELLPEWYMPKPALSASERTPRRTIIVAVVVFALLLLNGAGLCVTYGLPEIAW